MGEEKKEKRSFRKRLRAKFYFAAAGLLILLSGMYCYLAFTPTGYQKVAEEEHARFERIVEEWRAERAGRSENPVTSEAIKLAGSGDVGTSATLPVEQKVVLRDFDWGKLGTASLGTWRIAYIDGLGIRFGGGVGAVQVEPASPRLDQEVKRLVSLIGGQGYRIFRGEAEPEIDRDGIHRAIDNYLENPEAFILGKESRFTLILHPALKK